MPVTVSALICVCEDVDLDCLEISIKSIVDFVDEVVVVDNSNDPAVRVSDVLDDINSDKIKCIKFETLQPLSVVANVGITAVSSTHVLEWGPEYVGFSPEDNERMNPGNLIIEINKRDAAGYDGIILWAPMLYGDLDHMRKNGEVKKSSYIVKKNLVSYKPSDRYAYELSFASNGNFVYANDPTKDPYYFVMLTNCRSTVQILYNAYKSQYWRWVFTAEKKLSFRNWFEKVLGSDYHTAIQTTEKSIAGNAVKHNYSLPVSRLESKKLVSDPNFKVRRDPEIGDYRDYNHYGRPVPEKKPKSGDKSRVNYLSWEDWQQQHSGSNSSSDSGSSGTGSGSSGSGDAGSSDSGSGDAGSGDAGSGDAGSGDAGSGDAGSGDAGSGDAGSGDAGSGDSGSGDADSGDSGSGDAGSGDAGSGDPGSGDAGSGDTGSGDADSGDADAGSGDADSGDASGDNGDDTTQSDDQPDTNVTTKSKIITNADGKRILQTIIITEVELD